MRSILAIWLITFLSLASISAEHPPACVAQQGNTVTVEEYWQLVRNTQQSISQMEAKSDAEIHEELEAFALEWNQVTAVELSDQNVIAIDSTYMVARLRETPADIQNLSTSFQTLLLAHEEFPKAVFTLQDVEPLRQILTRPEFQWDRGQTLELPAWLRNALDSIGDFFDRVIFGIVDLIYEGRVLWMILALVLFVFSLVYISRNLSRSLIQDAQLDGEDGDDAALLTSKGALQRAQMLSTQGDYRNAVRYLYLSSLLVLDEQGLLRYDRSRTNREYLRSVSSRPELANPLRDVIDVFDRVWYGFESVDEETYRSYVEHVEELRKKQSE